MARILVVDDDRNTLDAVGTILRREGHTVLTALSGKEVLDQLEEDDVELILSDVKMPRMDGLALLRHVKAQHADIVVMMMSGHQDVAAAVEAMKAGAFDYLIKPFGRDEVVRAVQKGLALRALMVENIALKRQVRDQFARAQVIGSSPIWRKVGEMVELNAAALPATLLEAELFGYEK